MTTADKQVDLPESYAKCKCGHNKSDHIYEEGACRPGFVCECKQYSSNANDEQEEFPQDIYDYKPESVWFEEYEYGAIDFEEVSPEQTDTHSVQYISADTVEARVIEAVAKTWEEAAYYLEQYADNCEAADYSENINFCVIKAKATRSHP